MQTRPREVSAIALAAQAKIDDIKRHPLYRVCVFALSLAGVYFLFRLAYEGFLLLPSVGAGTHATANPALDALKALHSGFGN
jgi:hypothetical protein